MVGPSLNTTSPALARSRARREIWARVRARLEFAWRRRWKASTDMRHLTPGAGQQIATWEKTAAELRKEAKGWR